MTDTHSDPARGPIPPWLAYSGVIVVGGVALAVLAWYQHRFGAEWAQMPWLLSWSFSIGLDWGGVVAGAFWFLGTGQLSTWGRWSAITLVAGSTILTCIAFGLIAGWTYAPLGAVHSLVAFLMAKLLTLWQVDRAARRGAVDALDAYRAELDRRAAELVEAERAVTERAEAAAVAEAAARDAELAAHDAQAAAAQAAQQARTARTVPAGVPAAGVTSPRPPAAGDADLIERVAAFIRAKRAVGEACGQRPIATHFKVGRTRAGELMKAAEALLAEDDTTSAEPATPTEPPHVNGARVPIPTTGATP